MPFDFPIPLMVKPTLPQGRRGMKVAFDGEVTMMHAPLDIRVLAKPLYLLRLQRGACAVDAGSGTEVAGA